MIFGILHRDKNKTVDQEQLLQLLPPEFRQRGEKTFAQKNLALGVGKSGVATIDDGAGLATSPDQQIVVVATGNIFNQEEMADPGTQPENVAQTILAGYEKSGDGCFQKCNGNFAAAIWDGRNQRFLLALDHVGFEPLFYYWDEHTLIFCSSFKALIRHKQVARDLNYRAIRNYLLFNYNAGLDTFVQKVKKVRPAHLLIFENEKLRSKRYWVLSYKNQNNRAFDDYKQELLDLTRDALKIRTRETASDPGAFLSGGMDSSSVVGLLSGFTDKPVHTFSFRCPEKFVDESYFARVMAEHYKTRHNEIAYTAEQLQNMENMAAAMEEPLNDIGVELGSYIMGRAASEQVKYILTGDGGDELYAGHPVYLADRVADKFDKIPAPLRAGITKGAGLLPDSDKKKGLVVKARRFAYSYRFPPELLSNRWRMYYQPQEFRELCTPQVLNGFGDLDSYEDITALYEGADGPDFLSRCLYGDYQTLVRFHVDRLRLTRASGVEARFPLHDYRLIEFSATIPAGLKIRDSQVKYVQKKALEGVLPDEIVFRKDKMGHNVPMKNWMRESPIFLNLLHDVLSKSTVDKRGFFKHATIQKMVDQHLKKTKDHSHRLYGMLILELWLQKNF